MKITSLDNLEYTINNIKNQGKSVAMCHGVFDLLHLGHIKHLEKAKEFGDYLVVTVTPDKHASKAPGRPIFNEQQRAEALEALSCVDMVGINEWSTAVETIKKLKPNIYIKGKDYLDLKDARAIDEKDAIESVGGIFVFTNEITFSSSNVINKYTFSDDVVSYLDDFCNRYSINDVLTCVDYLNDTKVAVIGEAVIDEYIFGNTIGKSNKSPSLVFSPTRTDISAGVPFNVANHLSTFCKYTRLITIVNENDVGFVKRHMNNIDADFWYSEYPTIVKRSYINENPHTKVFEVYDFDINQKLAKEKEDELVIALEKELSKFDVVIVCDSGHGMINSRIRNTIKNNSAYLAVNTQMNAGNIGIHSIRKYWDRKDNTYICVNEREFRLATHEHWDDFIDIDSLLFMEEFFGGIVAITRGPDGCKLADWEGKLVNVPAFACDVVDPVGAGDAFLAITSPLSCNSDVPLEIMGFIGNAMGTLATSYDDNKEYITKDKLVKFIKTLMAR